MAEIINNEKGFKVIKVSIIEIANWGGFGICDWCDGYVGSHGYYVAVLHTVMCEKCYKEWCERATYYPEDKHVEDRHFNYMKIILNL